jgi:glycine dehydrogenase subunit 1
MMCAIGISDVDELFRDIPESLRLKKPLDLPGPLSEMELIAELREIAGANKGVEHYISFLGAGAYDHFVPSAVNHLVTRSEFYTSYTPYQAETSQGILQAIYEFQTMVCILTGMDVANASVYDGATAAAEAAVMSLNASGRKRVLVSQFVNPEYRSVISTYLSGGLATVDEVRCPSGVTEADQLRGMLGEDVASVVVQYPNFAGIVEDLEAVAGECHRAGAALIVIADPIALGLLQSPGTLGADIVVGEGQSMGSPLHYGGPYLGFMCAREKYLRYLPGRISGATTDGEGNRGFVLTLQAREQHIRRERAYSNICTNQSLNALAATIYLSLMGKTGLRRVGELCLNKSHYLAGRLCEISGVSMAFEAPFFKEFVVRLPVPSEEVVSMLRPHRILAGVPMGRYYQGMEDLLLVCVTEQRTKEDMDEFVQRLGAIL